MALAATIQFEVRQTGSDTNGGGFNSAASGTDWTLQNAAQYAVADGVTAGTSTITSATAAFGTDVVGNVAYVAGGTGAIAAGWYEITARNSATSITVDRSTGLTTGTGVTLRIGGALATPGRGTSLCSVSGHKTWVKYNATPYSITTSTVGPAGPAKFVLDTINCSVEGYETTRGDRTANRPVYQWNTAVGATPYAYALTTSGNAEQELINLCADGNSRTGAGGFDVSNPRAAAIDCVAKNCNQSGAIGFNTSSTRVIRCNATSCTDGFHGLMYAFGCEAVSCTNGFTASSGGMHVKCIARSCTNGWTSSLSSVLMVECTADSNTASGFDVSSSNNMCVNCISTNQSGGGGIGFKVVAQTKLLNCAAYNNTTPISGTAWANIGQVTVTADPYVAQASADFRLNTTTGGGAALRAAGVGNFSQTNNEDIGAVQHTDPGGIGRSPQLRVPG